jgi:hypothetical protein
MRTVVVVEARHERGCAGRDSILDGHCQQRWAEGIRNSLALDREKHIVFELK